MTKLLPPLLLLLLLLLLLAQRPAPSGCRRKCKIVVRIIGRAAV